jgi:hypothetical protein
MKVEGCRAEVGRDPFRAGGRLKGGASRVQGAVL